VCFVDMAGFTALTEEQGDEDAAAIATRFADLTLGALKAGERLVKSIGDAVMVTCPTPGRAVRLIERLMIRASGLPPLRAGIHYGPVVEKKGDVFGATVNLAARIAAEAHAGEVLSTKAIADAAEKDGIPVIELGEVLLKNVSGPVPLYALGLVLGVSGTPIDPVCRIPVDRRAAVGTIKHRGKEYWFCSTTCIAAFASNPGWHVAQEERQAE
jgi:class 3 adenylate cyclase/YHS domain-containing protein